MKAWRWINIALCLLGVFVFGGMLIYLHSLPNDFEARAQAFITDRIDAELAADGPMSKLAKLDGLPSDRIDALRVNLAASTRNFIHLAVEALCTCGDRAAIEDALLTAYDAIELKLKPRFEVLRGMVEAKYHAVFDELRRDITIFLGANLIVLGIALILALFRGRAARHLAPISALLTVTTLLTSNWYLFDQNWVLTIIYSDYLGWSYLVFLGVVFLLLADIALNQARVVSGIFNAVSGAFGAGQSWSPC
ncbi:hypothetical protein [Dongia sedimenti]|uniref:DUF1461 domain-containing protein n=1 Tax=Dongia sedimenti TaxID=3064282 RepID=A0ABU0YG38_9PROT|nr:hypothetical protein [Rhodospirillaceae bacterium R-7]